MRDHLSILFIHPSTREGNDMFNISYFTPRLTRASWVVLPALLAFFLSACGDDKAPGDAAVSGETTATAAAASAGNEAQESRAAGSGKKLNLYISCYNSLDKRAHDSINYYAYWIDDMDVGPTGREKVVHGLYALNMDDIAKCQKDFGQAVRQKPELKELDAASKDYVAALSALGASIADIYPYYDRKDYKDDGFAKGKAAHAPLVKDMYAFMAASKTFAELLNAENDKELVAQLARIEKVEGRKIRYWNMALMLEAKQLADILGNEDFPVDVAVSRLESFEKVADEANAYVKANKKNIPFWIENDVENFRKAAKERVRRVRDKTPYSRSEQMNLDSTGSWMVHGSPGRVAWAYNSLVNSSNRL
jgi:hypothetical protein